MTTLVTGGAGFIGSHIVEALVRQGERVVVVDDLSTGRPENVPADVPLHRLDVADDGITELVEGLRPDAIVHAAAQVSVPASVRDPVADATTNVLGTIRLAQAAVDQGVGRFVFISTGGAIYGRDAAVPTTEDEPAEPISPYGIGKLSAERYLRAIVDDRAVVAILRLANVYGPRQGTFGEAGVVAIMVHALLDGAAITIDGDGQQTRDFVYVADVADAVVAALRHPSSGTWNIGTGREQTINALLDAAVTISARTPTVRNGPARSMDLRRSCLDAGRARHDLGWVASTAIEEGLRRTFASMGGVYSTDGANASTGVPTRS